MNLYEYSELNNREMGVLLHRESLGSGWNDSNDSNEIFEDAINEIKSILNGAELEKKSKQKIEDSFEMDIIKNQQEKCEDHCRKLNKYFINKRFTPELKNNTWHATCKNYFDKINVTIYGRVDIEIVMDEDRLRNIFNKFSKNSFEFSIHGFKLYWNWHKSPIYLYLNSQIHSEQFEDDIEKYKVLKKGIDDLIILLRNYI